MFNVCEKCGSYHSDKEIDPSGPYAICPDCGNKHSFLRLPLFCLTGASGTGKTRVCLHIMRGRRDVVVMESDILWRKEFDSPETDWREYRNLWLRVCKNISQSGCPVLLCGSVSPGQFESCVEARYFSAIHYLALVCNDEVIASRLSDRPAWRESSIPEFVKKHVDWNRWFKTTQHEQDVTLLDTTAASIAEMATGVLQWIDRKWKNTQSNIGCR